MTTLTIRLFQFNWLQSLMFVLTNGFERDWASMIAQMLMALGWALLLQKFSSGEDLIASFFAKKKENSETPSSDKM